jgi:hypothetical protein
MFSIRGSSYVRCGPQNRQKFDPYNGSLRGDYRSIPHPYSFPTRRGWCPCGRLPHRKLRIDLRDSSRGRKDLPCRPDPGRGRNRPIPPDVHDIGQQHSGRLRTSCAGAREKYRKLDQGLEPVPGQVGRDRIQQGHAKQSIGEAIRHWYNLLSGDFERVDIDIEIFENVFYITPQYKLADPRNKGPIPTVRNPPTFTRDHISRRHLWVHQSAPASNLHLSLPGFYHRVREFCPFSQTAAQV